MGGKSVASSRQIRKETRSRRNLGIVQKGEKRLVYQLFGAPISYKDKARKRGLRCEMGFPGEVKVRWRSNPRDRGGGGGRPVIVDPPLKWDQGFGSGDI